MGASTTEAGIMTAVDKTKVDSVTAGAQPNYPAMDQATAEAGTSTSLLSVTALRIRQAILGWWNTSSAKTKLDSIPSFPPADGKSYVWTNGAWVEQLSPIVMSGQIGTFHTGTAISGPVFIGFNDIWVNKGGIVFEGATSLRRFTVPKTGVYRVCGNFVSGPSSTARVILGKNVSAASPPTTAAGNNISQCYAPGGNMMLTLNQVVELNAGDSIGFYLSQGAIQNTITDSWGTFSIERISE